MNWEMKLNEETILKYLDGHLNEEAEKVLLQAVEEDKELRELLEHHKEITHALKQEALPSPSPGFANRVMESVHQLQLARSKFFNRSRLFVISLISIVLLTTIYYFSINLYPTLGHSLANDLSLRQFSVDLNPAKAFLNSDLLFKIVFYVNGIICLFLLDRAILKPYFTRRRERFSM